jgi:uncharacterized protein
MTDTADFWIKNLQLLPHPEGGYFREVFRSPETISAGALPERYKSEHSFATSIYFLLKSDQISTFHRLKSDEIWYFYDGSPITVYIIDKEGKLSQNIVGRNILNNEQLQLVIPHECWFAAKVVRKDSYTLVGCNVAPGFDFNDFELAEKSELIECFPQHQELISKMCIK